MKDNDMKQKTEIIQKEDINEMQLKHFGNELVILIERLNKDINSFELVLSVDYEDHIKKVKLEVISEKKQEVEK